ncbi:MAG: phosphoribosyltransferase [Methylobacteriaceae bacterium]|nr:phosphoribosyltransferase [Methylobacteriaceae bacterium]
MNGAATNGSGAPLVLAVPSKGRLQDNAAAFFARAGLDVVRGRGVRDYRGTLKGLDNVEIAFLSAAEITTQLAAGAIHMGITGEDLVRETITDADERVELLAPLGFGNANVVLAVPRAWIDVRNMADLEDVASAFRVKRGRRMRVATKYVNLTRRFFAASDISDYRIVESLGATEGAPAAGQAELIVDITTTGATLEANALKVLDDGVILRSEANLVASLSAEWSQAARESARLILSRIAAEEEARTTREVRTRLQADEDTIGNEAARLFDARLGGRGRAGLIVLTCAKERVSDLADWLIGRGAEHITVGQLDYVFSAKNALYDRLARRLA